MEVGRSIATLKQKKLSAKTSFTRPRNKFWRVTEWIFTSRCGVKEFQKKIDEQLQKVMTLITELSVLCKQSKNLDGQNRMVDEMEIIDEEYSNIMDQAK